MGTQRLGPFSLAFQWPERVDVFNAGDVAAKQAGTLFDVALGEFLFLAQFADAITNYHRGIISLRTSEGK